MISGKTGPRMQHILGRPRYAVVLAKENLVGQAMDVPDELPDEQKRLVEYALPGY